MKDWIIIAILIVAIVALVTVTNKPPGRDLTEKPTATADAGEGPITNQAGQVVTYVEREKLNTWLSSHRDIRIVTMAGYTNSNYTRGYYVVYEPLAPEKK